MKNAIANNGICLSLSARTICFSLDIVLSMLLMTRPSSRAISFFSRVGGWTERCIFQPTSALGYMHADTQHERNMQHATCNMKKGASQRTVHRLDEQTPITASTIQHVQGPAKHEKTTKTQTLHEQKGGMSLAQ